MNIYAFILKMSYIKKTLKLEIESYLHVCGLFETLEVFREECRVKLEDINDEDSFKNSKRSLAKRYFENDSDICKTRQRVDFTRKELAASIKKLDRLNVKVRNLKEVCSKHISFNLELVNAIKTKMLNTYSANSKQPICVYEDTVLNDEKLHESLAKNISAIYCDENASKVEHEENMERLCPVSSSVIDCSSTISSNSYISSDIQIIPDSELRFICPLVSDISLASCLTSGVSARNMIPMNNSTSSLLDSQRLKECKDLNDIFNNECDFNPLTCRHEMHHGSISSSSCCFCDCCQNKESPSRMKNDKGSGLRRWCEEFLKNSNDFHEAKSHGRSKPNSCSKDFDKNSLRSFVSSVGDSGDCTDSETSYAESYFTEKIISDTMPSSTDMSKAEGSLSNKSIAGSPFFCHKQDLKLCNGSHIWKQKHQYQRNLKVNFERHMSSSLGFSNKSAIVSSPKQGINNDHNDVKKFFSDTYLPKTENKMADKMECKTTLNPKMPFMMNNRKVKENEPCISNNNQRYVLNYDLGSTYTFQNESRLKMACEKEMVFSDGDFRCYKKESFYSSHSDGSRDNVSKEAELCNNNDFLAVNTLSGESDFYTDLGSFSNLRKLNSATSQYSNSPPKLKTSNNNAGFKIFNNCNSMPVDTSCYSEFKKNLKTVQSSSTIDLCPSKCEKQRECSYGNSKGNFLSLSESEFYYRSKLHGENCILKNRCDTRLKKCFNEDGYKKSALVSTGKRCSSISSALKTKDIRIPTKSENLDRSLHEKYDENQIFRKQLSDFSQNIFESTRESTKNAKFCSCSQNKILGTSLQSVERVLQRCSKCSKGSIQFMNENRSSSISVESDKKFRNVLKRKIRHLKIKSRSMLDTP